MKRPIPAPLISICAEIISRRETHATLDSLFAYADAPGDPPAGSKLAKATEWLRITNKTDNIMPLLVLGRLIEGYMEESLDVNNSHDTDGLVDQERIQTALSQYQLQYVKGGKIIGSLGAPSQSLENFIADLDVTAINSEFDRALENIDAAPREAISAASNILETICKVYIEEEGLKSPQKQDLRPIWSIVRKDLGLDPSLLEDQDLQQILSGLISTVEGIASLRTHASSAHGAGKKSYKLEPRHARLTVHAAHTLALFILETWQKKKRQS